ncbi:MFS transporter [Pantoea sp. DY-15]|uniref:MFS transporter n=1 Tax=Pantoea sp. DY-15 TaxID=2871489 RepID=UPI001C989B7F|nr:MFS transporter [Pantoea sp. DY-15]MBY4890546.1 MFS transporter [Pantoea sp. DY-15]
MGKSIVTSERSITVNRPGRREDMQSVAIKRGTKEYLRAGISLFLLGFASFSLIYCVQPLLPAFSGAFSISPAQSSLALSFTKGLLAVSILLSGAFSQALGRKGLMFTSMMLASVCNIVAAIVPEWHQLLIARAIEGVVLGGVPAVAMAWLAEEIEPTHLGKTMGLYVGGTAFGAMMGRVGMGLLTELTSWRGAMEIQGLLCLVSAVGFYVLLPFSKNFVKNPGFNVRFHLKAWGQHLSNPGLIRLYVIGFFLTSIFVTLFNYATFRLSEVPFNFNQTQISSVFCAFAFGIVSSSVAGTLADKLGKKPLLIAGFFLMLAGSLCTLSSSLAGIVAGIIMVTTGFFISHSVASGAVGPLSGTLKGHASSLYLLFYYMGSSVTGSAGGWFWQHGGWSAIVYLTAVFSTAGMIISASVKKK